MYSLRLRELRDKHHMTQQDVASRLQLSRDAYSLYELGKRQMSYETLLQLAALYNVSIDYLLGRYDSNPIILSNDELGVIAKYRLLDKRGRETIKANLSFEESHIIKTEKEKNRAI